MRKCRKKFISGISVPLRITFRLFMMTVLGLNSLILMAQQTKTASGTVIDEDGLPVIGASVVVKGTTIGIVTDVDGKFIMTNVPASANTLVISYIGMLTQEVACGQNLNILMRSDVQQLEEVMVVAYGTVKKSSFTGSASLVKNEIIEQRPVTNVTDALLGTAPGVNVSTSNGHPGSEPSIYIRGIGSFSASNTPLIILNGMPYDNAISSINPGDIESMTVLKDASSAALYGSRAANGVILINTKTGNKERLTVNVKFNHGFVTKQTGDYNRVGLNDYVTLYWENLRNQYISDGQSVENASQNAAKNLFDLIRYNPFSVPNDQVVDATGQVNPSAQFLWADDTDWVNALQQTGNRDDATLGVSGGTEKSDYYASFGYTNEQGYIIGSGFERYTMSTNVNSQINKWFKTGATLSANISKTKGVQDETSGNLTNPFRFMRYVAPIYPIHVHDPNTKDYLRDNNGNLMYDFGTGYSVGGVDVPKRDFNAGVNPAIELKDLHNQNKRNTINAKAYTEISFIDGLKLTLNGSVGLNSYLASNGTVVYAEKGNTGDATKTNTFTTTWTFNQLLSYNKTFGMHHVEALLGHESYDYEYNYLRASMKDQKFDGNYEFGNYSNLNTTPNSYTHTYTTEGYLSRVNYDYDNRYFLSGSFRRDGSSRFYKDSRWGDFWSIGGGWRIDREAFMENITFIDYLKLRASYGEVGNDNLDSYYPWQATYEIAQNAAEAGFIQSSLGNKNLKWEESRNSDIALEFTICDSRFNGSFEFFNRQSDNLLFSVPLSPSTGVDAVEMNAGTMYNRGFEIDLNANIIRHKDLSWSVGANAMYLTNKITRLPVEPYVSTMFKIEEGHPRYDYWLRQWEGVDPETGNCLYIPTEEALAAGGTDIVSVDGKQYTTNIEKALYAYSGQASPKMTGGFNTNVGFKGLTLSLNFYYQVGGQMYDVAYSNLMTPLATSLAYSTFHTDMLNRWRQAGDRTDVPRIVTNNTNLNAANSTRWLVSSDMLELTNINLSYDLPSQWLKSLDISGIRITAAANNLFQVTARKGIYPRKNIFSGYASNGDVYLPSRVFTLGFNLTF